MDIFELRIDDNTSTVDKWATHSAWDTEEHAYEAAKLMGMKGFFVQPRRIMDAQDLAHMVVP